VRQQEVSYGSRISEWHGNQWHYIRRAFRLPLNAHRDGIRVAYTDDLFEVTVEKRAESKPVKIQVN
jgi:HSP20 family molecular chaperone IbpA